MLDPFDLELPGGDLAGGLAEVGGLGERSPSIWIHLGLVTLSVELRQASGRRAHDPTVGP